MRQKGARALLGRVATTHQRLVTERHGPCSFAGAVSELIE